MIATVVSDNFRVHQIFFAPDSTGGAYSAPPDPLSGLRGGGREGQRKRNKKNKGIEEGNGRDRPPLRKFLVPPLHNQRPFLPRKSSAPPRGEGQIFGGIK